MTTPLVPSSQVQVVLYKLISNYLRKIYVSTDINFTSYHIFIPCTLKSSSTNFKRIINLLKKMKKTFVPISTESHPEPDVTKISTRLPIHNTLYPENPAIMRYEICCPPKRPICKKPRRTMTAEDEIRQTYGPIVKKDEISKSRYKKDIDLACFRSDKYVECVQLQRRPQHLKYNTMVRDKAIKTIKKIEETRYDVGKPPKEFNSEMSVLALESATAIGEVLLRKASPACSLDVFYMQSRRLLNLRQAKSGVYINENQIEETDIPFDGYNPRELQPKADQMPSHRLIERDNKYFFKMMDDEEREVGGEDDDKNDWSPKEPPYSQPCCCLFFRKTFEDYDEFTKCMQGPKIYPVASELGRWFSGTTILGSKRFKKEKEDVKEHQKRRRKSLAALYTAFGSTYTTLIKDWQTKTIDDVLNEAEELCDKSVEWAYVDKKGDFDIIPELADKQIVLKITPFSEGSLNSGNPNILKSLDLFFQNGHACIVLCCSLYLLIWRMCNGFCVFDPNGRNEKCERDWFTGKAALMKTKPLEHVGNIILNMSDLQAENLYKIYEISLVNFGTILKPIEANTYKAKKYYLVINKNFAVIPGTEGMPPPEDSEDNNESLFVALFALIYSCIDPPRHWTRRLINGIVHFGIKYCHRYTKKMELENVNASTLPSVLYLGNYRIDIEVKPFAYSGHLCECDNYRYSPLIHFLEMLFKNFRGGILQVDQSAVAIWRESDCYFIFDPFTRNLNGKVSEDGEFAILHMHITLESLLRTLYTNGLGMMSDGHFFIHPILIKSISFMTRIHHRLEKVKEALQISFPVCCEVKKKVSCSDLQPPPSAIPTRVPDECLSLLSVSPCKRTCSESNIYAQEKKDKAKLKKQDVLAHADSLESLPSKDKIPEDDGGDIALPVLNQVICLIIVEIAARSREKEKPPIKAEKVLLKSDLGYLQKMKQTLKRGEDYDNLDVEFPTELPREETITLEKELQIPTNFLPLPDGTWILMGNIKLEKDDLTLSVLATFVAAAFSKKYKISTWDTGIVDSTMTSAESMKQCYIANDVIDLLFENKVPKVAIGGATFQIKHKKLICGRYDTFEKSFEEMLTQHTYLLVIFNSFSCLIIRRYNFFYLFMGFGCDLMGFRTARTAPPCLLRLQQFSDLLHRIDFNRCESAPDQAFAILAIHVKDISGGKRKFQLRSELSEELLYEEELEDMRRRKKRYFEKLAFLDDEISKETKRIESFKQLKEERKAGGIDESTEDKMEREGEEDEYEDEEQEQQDQGEEEEEGEEEEVIEKKHLPGTKLPNIGLGYADKTKKKIEFGYTFRKEERLFKIQGTNAMEDRSVSANDEIRACYFASMYAILFASIRPFSKWEFRRVDRVLEEADSLFSTILDKTPTCLRKVDNIEIDDYILNITIKTVDRENYWKDMDLANAISSVTKTRKFFMLQLSNVTFAIYKDEYWHLFDSYSTLDTLKPRDDLEKEPFFFPKGLNIFVDRNTASWVLLPTKDALFNYIDKRAIAPGWRKEYRLHVIDVRSFKKAPKSTRLLNFLLKDIFDVEDKPFDDLDCLPEEVKWLESDPIPWSRKNHVNILGNKRGTSIAMWKSFDIEIPEELFSLWGTLHPLAAVFRDSRGKQYLATNVIALCMASIYRVTEWNTAVLDTIVINGDKYFKESLEDLEKKEYEFTLEDLNLEYEMHDILFYIHLESILIGKLYNRNAGEFNLSVALVYFFTKYRFGVIQCLGKSLAFGRANKGYFLFDCQSFGNPLFPEGQGCSYILLCTTVKSLLYCMVRTLRIPYYNQYFHMYKVDISVPNDEEEEDGEEGGEEQE